MKITKRIVRNKISVLNKLRGGKERPWDNISGKNVANIGCIYLEGHGEPTHYHLLQIVNEGGAVKDVFTLEALTLRNAYFGLIGMIEGMERYQQRRD